MQPRNGLAWHPPLRTALSELSIMQAASASACIVQAEDRLWHAAFGIMMLIIKGNHALYIAHVPCRQRLSNDSFSQFLQAIKELNSGKKTREDTLHTALEIFGSDNGDLYSKSFSCS